MANLFDVRIGNGVMPNLALGAAPDAVAAATVASQMARLGFAPSTEGMAALMAAGTETLITWWEGTKPALERACGADRDMDAFVVYKNFPDEVLDKTEADYWTAQILMYLGAPNTWFTEHPETRPVLSEATPLKVLRLDDGSALSTIAADLAARRADWTEEQRAWMEALVDAGVVTSVDFATYGSRANAARLAAWWLRATANAPVAFDAPTDALRLAAAWSDGDPGLRTPGRLLPLPQAVRRRIAAHLEGFGQGRLEEDFAARPKTWKALLHALHAGKGEGALANATARLRAGTLRGFEATVENGLKARDRAILQNLETRPGAFARRLHQTYARFGRLAFERFAQDSVLARLTTGQLLRLDRYIATVADRATFLVTPRGKMSKSQVLGNQKVAIDPGDAAFVRTALSARIAQRLNSAYPEGFDVGSDAHLVGLPENGQEAGVARGTVFPIPANARFLRSASFWATGPSNGNIWFDNGWNFFDASWAPAGVVCWNAAAFPHHGKQAAAVFSGDPTNSKDLEGRACQMIDLTLDRLEANGVAYAAWSILSFNSLPFGDANDVLATLQWGEDPQKGKLYEPSRSQVILPLSGPDKAKVVAILDVAARQLVFLDTNLPCHVSSANSNGDILAGRLPALMERVACTPTVADLFTHGAKGTIPVRHTDGDAITGKALVFQTTHPDSAFEPLPLAAILNATG